MRSIFTGIFAIFVLTSMATTAEARRGGGYSTNQELLFVSPTEIENDLGPLSVCHLVKTRAIIFINVWRTLEGYALANNGCMTDAYFDLSAEELSAAQLAGAISKDVPATPKLSMAQVMNGSWGLGLIAALVGFAIFKAFKIRARRNERMSFVSGASPVAQAIIDAMCHAAKADGHIAPSEIAQIKQAAEEMTGETFTNDTVAHMASIAEAKLDQSGFKRLVKSRSPAENMDIMRGVLMVVAADGRLDGKEKVFVGGLAQAMKMSGQQVAILLAEVTGQLNSV